MLHIHEWHSDGTGEGQCDCDGRWFKNKRLYDLHLADAVIAALDLGIPCATTGCRMRQLARRGTASTDERAP